MKSGFWTKDWFAGLVVTVLVLVGFRMGLVDGLELAAYDVGVRGAASEPSDRVAVIAIDTKSLENIGRWPWPRDVQGQIFDVLKKAGAKVVGSTVFYVEPQADPGLQTIEALDQFVQQSSLARAGAESLALGQLIDGLPSGSAEVGEVKQQFRQSVLSGALEQDLTLLGQALQQARVALDSDAALSSMVGDAGNVVLPMLFVVGDPIGNPDAPLPEFVRTQQIRNVVDRIGAVDTGAYPLTTIAALPPIDSIGSAARAVGSLLTIPDADGGLRADPLVVAYYEGGQSYSFFPSLALQVAAASLNLTPDDIEVRLGEGVRLGRLTIGTDPSLRLLSFFYGDGQGGSQFTKDSFYDVITGTIKPDKYRDKVVLIGATAPGLGDTFANPVQSVAAPVEVLAHVVSSILNEDFFTKPEWGGWLKAVLVLLVALYLTALLPRLSAGAGAGVTIVLAVALLGTEYAMLVTQTTWIELVLPTTLLVIGHAVLTTKRFLVTERGKMAADFESAESNKSLGLAMQARGDLDMAFERFRRLPPTEPNLDLLYHLAPEFERKRQFAKAAAVYEYIAGKAPDFRDVKAKLTRSRAMEETVFLGGSSMAGSNQATLLLDGTIEKPMLGRYQVEKELGKGAMGVVYLGKDPKINRTVAIKTMALAQEFEEDELADVKERFFREAETAGRLSHPNIVTIFDAGEEHDLAYIAMEFLRGKDLVAFTKPDTLLPLPVVMDIAIASADALDYAHKQNVVHRDIKPANIMYEAESHSVKLTDFGIARITDSSKTKTGMVLGTPSYMSPEQLSGKKVDGRSDLFSLGVMLFQMTTGSLPFRGDSMATLMFQIANEPHPDPLEIKADLPACLKAIIDRSLIKDADKRYQTGAEMAEELRACKAQIQAG